MLFKFVSSLSAILSRRTSCLHLEQQQNLNISSIFYANFIIARNCNSVSSEKIYILRDREIKMAGENNVKLLCPNESVRGMTELDPEAFNKTVIVPVAKISIKHIQKVLDVLKKHYLKLYKFQSTLDCPNDSSRKNIYLCPLSYTMNKDQIQIDVENLCKSLNADKKSDLVEFSEATLNLTYKNWNAEDTLRAILPLDNEIASGFSIIGHILHLNLKEHLMPYKKLIGQILLDKTHASLIVNKVDTIDNSDNSYRSFSMEVLAGEGDTIATVRESKCVFELDFAKVYWNPRLEYEHSAIVKKLRREDILYDVMAGVGPFSVPAAKNVHCTVLANDLNPESYCWLVRNCKLNKVTNSVTCFNLDGGEFIKTALKEDLISRWKDADFTNDINITMNLPALAIEFLPNFVGLLKDCNISEMPNIKEPIVHVYMFSRDMKASSCLTKVAFYLGLIEELPDFDGKVAASLKASYDASKSDVSKCESVDRPKFVDDSNSIDIAGLKVDNVRFVRKVSRNKIMVRVTFILTKEILMSDKTYEGNKLTAKIKINEDCSSDKSVSKKIKLDL